MLSHLALIICCIFSIELFIRLDFKISLGFLKAFSEKAIKIIKSENISDIERKNYSILCYFYVHFIKSFFIIF